MTRVPALLAAASLIALAACAKTTDGTGAPPKPEAAADAGSSEASAAAAKSAARADRAATDAPVLVAPSLAMAYSYALILPTAQVRPLMESHQEACERAGPTQCQVLGADAHSDGHDRASARLSLRGTPAWMAVFRARAEADARDAGGKVRGSGTVGEDLTAPIVDAEAAQEARAAELARLQALMRRSGDLDETLRIEQEITRVQQEIDAAAAQIVAMKGRIAMQTLNVEYLSKAMVAPDGVTAPIAAASDDFVATMAWVFAVLIRVASVLTPIGLIAGPVVWFFTRRGKKAAAV
jgi:hypothetical protein